ncbi:MAG TPA: hypothetical protein PKD17_10300 [Cellvibrionaceae bacterium]|nr:hypothetical protein [Cellvibrionaceae bacterium]HMW72203.1 hypothetical protein [Cellvibrionaceae bacterium]HMY38521.1 hypothetical protein [Marinagarivorans sp.]
MKNSSIFSRIAILNNGRKAFLDYLRNLAPQTVLLSFSLLAAYKSAHDPQHEDALMVIGLLFLAAFFAACYANITLFYKDCFGENFVSDFKNYNTRIHRLCKIKRYSRTKRLIIASWITGKHKWIELTEQAFTVGFLQITLLVLIYLAGQNYLHMLPATK